MHTPSHLAPRQRRFSRHMPSVAQIRARLREAELAAPWQKMKTLALYAALALFLLVSVVMPTVVFGARAVVFPVLALAALWLMASRSLRKHQVHLQAQAASRAGEGICQFARQANCRQHDPWVVRAVYEGIAEMVAVTARLPAYPVRWDDALDSLLPEFHEDDVYWHQIKEMASRAGRSLDNFKANPWYGKVDTTGDLVRFFCAQPRMAA